MAGWLVWETWMKFRNMQYKLLGFKVEDFLELRDWRILDIDEKIPIVGELNCPSEGEELRTICTFIGNNGKKRMRVGCCQMCGYIGYIDRPTKDWINNFYLNEWDEAKIKDINKEVAEKKKGVLKKDKNRKKDMLGFLKKFSFDKNRYVFEIGSGYGGTLSKMRELGFEKVLGLENSNHRAQIASKAYGVRMIASPFEDTGTQEELKRYFPFGVIISHHVLEHTYYPDEIIKLASGLQEKGDYIILSMPNAVGEFSMGNLFFLPHLHSFTRKSLGNLLRKYGYKVLDDSLTTDINLYLVAKKISDSSLGINFEENKNYFASTLEKFKKCLDLDKEYHYKIRRLWWDRRIDDGGQLRFFSNGLIEMVHWPIAKNINRFTHRGAIIKSAGRKRWLLRSRPIQSLLITDVEKSFVSASDSPIEIQFPGNIKLAYK